MLIFSLLFFRSALPRFWQYRSVMPAALQLSSTNSGSCHKMRSGGIVCSRTFGSAPHILLLHKHYWLRNRTSFKIAGLWNAITVKPPTGGYHWDQKKTVHSWEDKNAVFVCGWDHNYVSTYGVCLLVEFWLYKSPAALTFITYTCTYVYDWPNKVITFLSQWEIPW